MANKKHIGELISMRFSDRKATVEGIVIDYNDDWTLMRSNPVDYVVDGYVIFRHKNIVGHRRAERERFADKILRLKGIERSMPNPVRLDDLGTILGDITERFGVFQLETRSEKACYLGRLLSIDRGSLTIDLLDPRGNWDGPMKFRPGDIRLIYFDTDYVNSLKLVASKRRRSQ